MVAAALLILVTAAPAFAQQALAASANPYEQQILQARYDFVSARVGFMTGVMSDTASLVPQASNLQAPADKLNSDLTTLNGYVQANDKEGFNAYIKGTLTSDVQAAQDLIKVDRQQFKDWNVTAQTKAELLKDYQARKATYDTQVNGIIIKLGNLKLDYYHDVMSKADDRMAIMSSKGIDISGMQGVQAEAHSNVVSPLYSAVNSGDPNAIRDQLKSRCLGNGAAYSDHYFAKMDYQALKAITSRIADNATKAGCRDQIADVNAKLSTVDSTLSTVGTSTYAGDQKDTIWNNLKAASEEIKTIIQELKGGQGNQG